MKQHLPAPSAWPAALAMGVTLAAAGLITSPLVLVGGAILTALAVAGWIALLLEEGET